MTTRGTALSGLDAEVSVYFQPVSFLLVQQEVIDIGEEFVRGHGGDEPLAVHSVFVQNQHAEVGPGDPEGLSAREHNTKIRDPFLRFSLEL